MNRFPYKRATIVIKKGNIIDETSDAIVCPANSFNHMRGGVAAVIRKAAGDIVEQDAMALAPVSVGKAVLTTGGLLKARYVIHAPTMRLPVEHCDVTKVKKAVLAALTCAEQHHLSSISFPGMGTGTGEVSYVDAADAMVTEIKAYLDENDSELTLIVLVAYSDEFYRCVLDAACRLL